MNQMIKALFIFATAAVVTACGQTKATLCAERAGVIQNIADIVARASVNVQTFDKAEFEKLTEKLKDIERKLEAASITPNTCS